MFRYEYLTARLVLQELEKFKFVLDYKIKELKKQIDPREQEIQDMKDQVRTVNILPPQSLFHQILVQPDNGLVVG